MGTSTRFRTPSGGNWTDLKRVISDRLGGNTAVTPEDIIGRTFGAAGGFGRPLAATSDASGERRQSSTGGATGSSGRRPSGGRAAVGRAIATLGGFGAAVRAGGLTPALERLGLGDLRGRPAAEVISRVAEHIAFDIPGTQGELLSAALRESIFDIARLEGDTSYENLEGSLQAFLNQDGVGGLIEAFLARLVFDRVWFFIEQHVQDKAATPAESKALASAVSGCIRGHVRDRIEEEKVAGRFDQLDWFGSTGLLVGDQIATELETRMSRLHVQGAK